MLWTWWLACTGAPDRVSPVEDSAPTGAPEVDSGGTPDRPPSDTAPSVADTAPDTDTPTPWLPAAAACATPNRDLGVPTRELVDVLAGAGSFEHASVETYLVEHPDYPGYDAPTASWIEAAHHDGAYGYKIEATDDQAGEFGLLAGVDKGREVEFIAYVRAPNQSVELELRATPWAVGEGTVSVPATSATFTATSSWTEVRFTASFEGDFDGLHVGVPVPPGATVQLDEVQVRSPWMTYAELDEPSVAVGGLEVPAAPTAPLHLNLLIHLEDDPQFLESQDFFERRTRVLSDLTALLAAHGGQLTLQTESAWLQGAEAFDPLVPADLVAAGAAISSHTHGPSCLDPHGVPQSSQTCSAHEGEHGWGEAPDGTDVVAYVAAILDRIEAATGVRPTDQNGNFDLVDRSLWSAAGVRSLTAFKDSATQLGLDTLYVHPWRPSDVDPNADPEGFGVHDPEAAVVYLPGLGPSLTRFHDRAGDHLGRQLSQALARVDAQRLNTFYVVTHVDDFESHTGQELGSYLDSDEYQADLAGWEAALTDVVDPLVASGHLRWTPLESITDAWLDWEEGCADVDPLPDVVAGFALNVHDWLWSAASIETVGRVLDVHESHGVPVDVHLTDPMVQLYLDEAPDLMERLVQSELVALSLHVRPPMPYYDDFDWAGLSELDDEALEAALRDYESHRVDLVEGTPRADESGGFELLAATAGYPPVSVSGAQGDERVAEALAALYAEGGATFATVHQEGGSDLEVRENGLLARPEHVALRLYEDRTYDAGQELEQAIASCGEPVGPCFVRVKWHEPDLYASDTPWWPIFWEDQDREVPRVPPFDHSLADGVVQEVPEDNQAGWWALYEDAVRWVAEHPDRVTAMHLGHVRELVIGSGRPEGL